MISDDINKEKWLRTLSRMQTRYIFLTVSNTKSVDNNRSIYDYRKNFKTQFQEYYATKCDKEMISIFSQNISTTSSKCNNFKKV